LENTLTHLDTPPDVFHAITYGLKSWFNNDRSYGPEPDINWPPPSYPYTTDHSSIQDAFAEQCDIGWEEFLRGRLSTKWGSIMQLFYKQSNSSSTKNTLAWEVTVIKTTWQIFLTCWEHRNVLKHGPDDEANRQIRSKDIDQQVRNAYRHDRNQVAPQHQGLFTNLHRTLDTSLDYKISWLHSIRSAKSAWINLLHQADPQANADDAQVIQP
jgi:hypothetical protein